MVFTCPTLVTIAFILQIAMANAPEEGLSTNQVAVVEGRAVMYEQVKVDSQLLASHFERVHGRRPRTQADTESIERERLARETRKLQKMIRVTIRQLETEKHGITVTKAEVERTWEKYLRDHHVDKSTVMAEGREALSDLLRSYEDVVDRGEDPDRVYDRRLAGVMSRAEWEMRLEHEATPERRSQLQRILEIPDDTLLKPDTGFRDMIVADKMNQEIDEDLMLQDPEFAEYISLRKTDPKNDKVQSKGPNYRTAKRFEWWQGCYRKANVEIRDPRFRGVWSEPFAEATPAHPR